LNNTLGNSVYFCAKPKLMIQRVQSVYLFLALLLMASLFFYPLANFSTKAGDVILDVVALKSFDGGVVTEMEAYPLAILAGISVLLVAVVIFLFKKRSLQARLAVITMVMMAGMAGMIYLYISMSEEKLGVSAQYTIVDIFPLIAIILVFLARRRIRLDEALVKSYDRIR
jgi:4-amino-4-deoxy-L-arabinose transferase-like glycosyltransferase